MLNKINWDALGISTSLICAIHCAIMPLLFTSLPLLDTDLIKDKTFEYIMIGMAFLIGVIALIHGFRKHHHKLYPIIIFTVGFIFLVGKEWKPEMEIPLLSVAVIFILTAHYLNYKFCRAHNHAHRDDCNH